MYNKNAPKSKFNFRALEKGAYAIMVPIMFGFIGYKMY